MKTRKRIGLIIANPEQIYQKRVLDGVMKQCERYDYDIVSFSPLVDIWFQDKPYREAELNIWNLINYELLDAVLLITITMTRNSDYSELEKVEKLLKERCNKPVVTLDLPIEGSEVSVTDDAPAFRKIISHILDIHSVPPEDIYVLSGREDLEISAARVRGCRQELEARGISTDIIKVFYGDFWYSGGADLAEKIISGKERLPRAVICGNDFMAIGLANRLIAAGIKVPEQVIITGYDATQDAVVNEVPITSFIPPVSGAAQEAVNLVHRQIDPGKPEIPADEVSDTDLCIGSSCGCTTNINYIRHNFQHALYKNSHDYTEGFKADPEDMSTVIESYMLESMTATTSPDECLEQIFKLTYLLAPYHNFYLVLRPDWLNTYRTLKKGYPDKVRVVVHTIPLNQTSEDFYCYHSDSSVNDFPVSEMLPRLTEPREKPSIFYFAPVHFQEDTLGYCVLQCNLDQNAKLTPVFRNWVRNVNNALEMLRIQNRLISYSLYDSMTGLYNRRGMDRAFTRMCRTATSRDSCFVCVIDMNWLKRINDSYGHPEGDYAISQLARCASDMALDSRFFAVRAGGDEFFVIGIGQFDEDFVKRKTEQLLTSIDRVNNTSGKPYKITAGIGCCLRQYSPGVKLEELIHEADMNMYEHKKLMKQKYN